MFNSDNWKENMENKISLPDFSHKIVDIAINAFYGKEYSKSLQKEDYLMLFQFADKYDMEKLNQTAKKSIVFTPSNVCEYANFFLQNFCDELVNCCIDYILSCSQYSVPIKDTELLDVKIRGMFFNRATVNPVFKKDSRNENRSFNFQ